MFLKLIVFFITRKTFFDIIDKVIPYPAIDHQLLIGVVSNIEGSSFGLANGEIFTYLYLGYRYGYGYYNLNQYFFAFDGKNWTKSLFENLNYEDDLIFPPYNEIMTVKNLREESQL